MTLRPSDSIRTASGGDAAPAATAHDTGHVEPSVWVYIVCGFVVTAAMVLGKVGLEKIPYVQRTEYLTRSFLLKLLPNFRESGAAALVIDISHLPGNTRDPATSQLVPTPRAELLALIEQLVDLGPAAIGVDIDFSGGPRGWQHPEDAAFFQRCLDLSGRVPIRLGVARSLSAPDGVWLVSPKFTPLAAALYVSESSPDTGNMPLSVGLKGAPSVATLGAALAEDTMKEKADFWDPLGLKRNHRDLHDLMFEGTVTRETRRAPYSIVVETREAPVNYSVVAQMDREHIPEARPGDLARFASRISERVVIIGDVLNGKDFHRVPGDDRARSGVYLHAAQAHSLTTEPIYVFSHHFRVLLDAVLPLAIMAIVLLARLLRPEQDAHARHGFENKVFWCAVAGTALTAVALALGARIFWPDFLLVIVVLLVHRWAEHKVLARVASRRTARSPA